jgi:hypothetical protein
VKRVRQVLKTRSTATFMRAYRPASVTSAPGRTSRNAGGVGRTYDDSTWLLQPRSFAVRSSAVFNATISAASAALQSADDRCTSPGASSRWHDRHSEETMVRDLSAKGVLNHVAELWEHADGRIVRDLSADTTDRVVIQDGRYRRVRRPRHSPTHDERCSMWRLLSAIKGAPSLASRPPGQCRPMP